MTRFLFFRNLPADSNMSKMTEEQKQRLQQMDYVAKQHGLTREEMTAMLERAIREAARKAVRNYLNVDVKIDEKGGMACYARLVVVEKVVDPTLEIDLGTALTRQSERKSSGR